MKSRSKSMHPLVLALLIALVVAPALEIHGYLAAGHHFSLDDWDAQAAYLLGRSTIMFIQVFAIAAIVLGLWGLVSGALSKSKAR